MNRETQGHCVYPLRDGRVSVFGSRALDAAKGLEAANLIKLTNTSERTKIGNRADGSWKYGFISQGIVEIIGKQ
jgi:hypothetical protein